MRFKKDAFDITLRIHNAATYELINELAEAYENRTTVLNECLDAGAPIVYERFFHRKALTAKTTNKQRDDIDVAEALDSMSRQMREMRLTQDDLYVMINNLEYMLATLFNVQLAELSDNPVSAEMVSQGLLSELPEELRIVKSELQHKYSKDKR